MKPIELYRVMLKQFGEQLWWPVTEPGETKPSYKKRKHLTEKQKLEVCIGALLAQNTDWKNAMKALENLNRAKMLDCCKIANSRLPAIAKLIRPSGYFNQKAKRLVLFARRLRKHYGCSCSKMLEKPLEGLRQELLSLHGIGNETADDIVLYAAQKPSFVVDAYTTRFVERFFGKQRMNYVEVKAFFEHALPSDAALFGEFHALLVEHGKRFCRKKPGCGKCLLEGHCAYALNANN